MADKLLRCSQCNAQVSSPVFAGTQIRAWIECYDCHKADNRVASIRALLIAVRDAAVDANWSSLDLIDAVEQAEKCLVTHYRP